MSRKRTRQQNEEAIARGEAARAALDDTVMHDAFRVVQNAAMDRVRKAATPGEAYDAALVLQISEQVWRVIKAFVADGKAAAADLDTSLHAARQAQRAELSHADYLTAARQARSEFDHLTTATREEPTHA